MMGLRTFHDVRRFLVFTAFTAVIWSLDAATVEFAFRQDLRDTAICRLRIRNVATHRSSTNKPSGLRPKQSQIAASLRRFGPKHYGADRIWKG